MVQQPKTDAQYLTNQNNDFDKSPAEIRCVSKVHFTLEKAPLGMDSKEATGFSAELMDAAQHTSQLQLHHPQHNIRMFFNTNQCISTFQKSQLEIIIMWSTALLNHS